MTKQTAVQWLVEQLENHNGVTRAGFEKCIQKAIKMEEGQICQAYVYGAAYGIDISNNLKPNIYYNEIYNNTKASD